MFPVSCVTYVPGSYRWDSPPGTAPPWSRAFLMRILLRARLPRWMTIANAPRRPLQGAGPEFAVAYATQDIVIFLLQIYPGTYDAASPAAC